MRSTDEWVGKTDDEKVPPRVRVRNFLAHGGKCQECGQKIEGKRWITDHRKAIINGGENRESNLGPIHERCDKSKTADDVAQKSRAYKKTAKRLGVKLRGGGFKRAAPQRSASRPLERKSEIREAGRER